MDVLVERVAADVVVQLQECERYDLDEWRFLNVAEVADVLGRSEWWVRDARKKYGLPYVRLDGGALAFDLEDVREWTEARRIPARDQDPLALRLQGRRDPASGNARRNRRRVANQKVEP